MAVAILVAGLAGIGGLIATYGVDDDAKLADRVPAGLAGGMALLAGGGLLGSLVGGIDAAVVVGLLLSAAPLALLARRSVRRRLAADGRATAAWLRGAAGERRRPALLEAAWWLAVLALLWLAFDRVVFIRDGAILTGYVNNLGDLPFHLQVTSSFSEGRNFPPTDPGYLGATFSYPYLADLVAAVLVRLGAPFREAFLVQNLVLGIALVGLLHRLTRLVTRDRLAAALAPLLLLMSGGLGFVLLLDEARLGEQGLLSALGSLTRDVTISGDGPWRWGNAITSLLVTQRGLLFGIAVGLLVLVLFWKLAAPSSASGERRLRVAVTAGVLAGLLPLIHLHTFAVVMGTAVMLGLLFRQWRERCWEAWVIVIAIALALAIPVLAVSTAGSQTNLLAFLALQVGWDRGDLDPVTFWLLNTGLFIPLAVAGLVWYGARARGYGDLARGYGDLVRFTLAFLPWFVVPNVVRLAPWIWDNNKVLIWWFIGFVPLVALLVAQLLRRRGEWRAAGIAALLVLTLAGSIDVWRVVSRQTEFVEFDADAIAIADRIRELTPPDAVVLHAPTWNTPVYLTGRRSVLGYPGHIWSRGLPYVEREAEIRRIYAGEPDGPELLSRYGVGYVLVGPLERSQLTVDEGTLGGLTLIAESGDEQLYEVTPR